MIKDAKQKAINEILKDGLFYEIPIYQRAYAWTNEQIEDIFTDLKDNEKEYFLGSIICITKDNKMHKVVDGQQRLTTISLLKIAIFNYLETKRKEIRNQEDEDKADEDITKIGNLKTSIFKEKLRLKLGIQNNNLEDYEFLYAQVSGQKLSEPKKYKTRRIYKNYKFFVDKIQELGGIEEVFTFLEKLDSAILIKIDVEDEINAFTLFSSLNDRGLPLTPIDLIKNLFIEKLKDKHFEAEATNNKWQKLLEDVEDYKEQIRFLKHFYNAFKADEKIKLDNFPFATSPNTIKIYNRLIERDANFLFQELLEKAEIYNAIIKPESLDQNDSFVEYKEFLLDLERLSFVPARALVLYLFVKFPHFDLSFILQNLDNYNVRRKLAGFPKTGTMDNIFLKVIERIEEYEVVKQVDLEKLIILEFRKEENYASDEQLSLSLKQDIYDNDAYLTRYILIKLEKAKRNREDKTDFWELNKKKSQFSLLNISCLKARKKKN